MTDLPVYVNVIVRIIISRVFYSTELSTEDLKLEFSEVCLECRSECNSLSSMPFGDIFLSTLHHVSPYLTTISLPYFPDSIYLGGK